MNEIEITNHDRILFIGDVHGDLLPLLGILRHAGVIAIDDCVFDELTACNRDATRKVDYNVRWDNVARWTGASTAVVLLGDLLDNKRDLQMSTTDRMYGVCALPSTQVRILHILWTLSKDAMCEGGRVVWILGNHCISNMQNTQSSMYAPSVFSENKSIVQSTTTGAWSMLVTLYTIRLSAVPVLLLLRHGKPIALALHGLLHPKFVRMLRLSTIDTGASLHCQLQHIRNNIALINAAYALKYDMCHLHDDARTVNVHSCKSKYWPSHCRSTSRTFTYSATTACFNVIYVFKGHENKFYNRHNNTTECDSLSVKAKNIRVYFLDTHMSRCFHDIPNKTQMYHYVQMQPTLEVQTVNFGI